MLGNAADHFMLSQMRERVVAITPNAGGQSLQVPDRERPGTAHVLVKAGFQVPGPQNQVSSGYLPGMGLVAPSAQPQVPRGMLPGMAGGMLPGMNGATMLPGMGTVTDLLTNKWVWMAAAAGALYLATRKA